VFSDCNWPVAHPRQAELQAAPFAVRMLRAACIMLVNGTVGRHAARRAPTPIIASLRSEQAARPARSLALWSGSSWTS
jgi:hypothetical protein